MRLETANGKPRHMTDRVVTQVHNTVVGSVEKLEMT